MWKRAVPAVVAGFLILLAGSSRADAAAPKACEVLSSQAATTLAGGPVKAPVNPGGNAMQCNYVAVSGISWVTLALLDSPGSSGANYITKKIGVGANDTVESVPALGEENMFVFRQSHMNSLFVFFHKKQLVLGVFGPVTSAMKANMIQAMRQMMTKF